MAAMAAAVVASKARWTIRHSTLSEALAGDEPCRSSSGGSCLRTALGRVQQPQPKQLWHPPVRLCVHGLRRKRVGAARLRTFTATVSFCTIDKIIRSQLGETILFGMLHSCCSERCV